MKHINFDRKKQRKLRHKRTTNTLKCAENTRPRLVVTKTDHHIYAQIIDDATSKVLASLEKKKLICRHACKEDLRCMKFSITQNGETLLAGINCDHVELPECLKELISAGK